MARWQITEPQYLNVPGTFWEQVTTDRVTQRPIRKQWPVPLFLDPRIQTDWNYDPEGQGRPRKDDMDGMIIVAYAGKGKPNDIIFEGPPNPGMLPLDDEAREISGQYNWTPTPDLSDEASRLSHSAKILDGLFQKLADAQVAPTGVPAGFDKFMESMAAMMQQQTQFMAMLVQKIEVGQFEQHAREIGAEPAVQVDEPLGEALEPTPEEIAESAAAKLAADNLSRAKAEDALRRSTGRRT